MDAERAHPPSRRISLRPGILALLLTLTALATPPLAEAKRNLYVSDHSPSVVGGYDISATGSLTGRTTVNAGAGTNGVAITPDGKHLYAASGNGEIIAFDVASNGTLTEATGSPFAALGEPEGIAVTPDGNHLYVANRETLGGAFAYDIAADGSLTELAGSPFAAGSFSQGVAASPDGKNLYITNSGSNDVSAYAISANGALAEIPDSPFAAGSKPLGVAIGPDGNSLYVANQDSDDVSAYDVNANGSLTEITGSPFPAGDTPFGVIVSPGGNNLYVGNYDSDDLSAYDIAPNGTLAEITGSPFSPFYGPTGLAATPDGEHLYVAEAGNLDISGFDIATGGSLAEMTDSPFSAGLLDPELQSIAITPNQPPVASLADPSSAQPGEFVGFDASASTDPDGTIAAYSWDFGDGHTEPNGGPTSAHAYDASGSYEVTLTLTDNEGCSTEIVYTGQTASCNGSPAATQTKAIRVTPTTKITKKPKGKIKTRKKKVKVKVSFSSEAGATFSCKLDKAADKPCTSPYSVKAKSKGGKGRKHTISVEATVDGVVGTPAVVKFKVIRKG